MLNINERIKKGVGIMLSFIFYFLACNEIAKIVKPVGLA